MVFVYIYLFSCADKYEYGFFKVVDVDKIFIKKGIEMDVFCYGIYIWIFFFTVIVYRVGSLYIFYCG